MSDSVLIIIDGAPVAKGRGRVGTINGHATIFTPANTRKYENLIRDKAGQMMEGRNPLDEPLRCTVEAFIPVPRSWSKKKQGQALQHHIFPLSRPDIDNYIKAALDGLNGIVFRDDALIVELVSRKRYSEKPHLSIEITPIRIQEPLL